SWRRRSSSSLTQRLEHCDHHPPPRQVAPDGPQCLHNGLEFWILPITRPSGTSIEKPVHGGSASLGNPRDPSGLWQAVPPFVLAQRTPRDARLPGEGDLGEPETTAEQGDPVADVGGSGTRHEAMWPASRRSGRRP